MTQLPPSSRARAMTALARANERYRDLCLGWPKVPPADQADEVFLRAIARELAKQGRAG